jgi:K+-sensing histidine kinase KdpD
MRVTSIFPAAAPSGQSPPGKTRSGELHAVRDDLAGVLAHDLRTPLAALSINLDYIIAELRNLEPDGSAGAIRAALDDCRQANLRAVRLVSDLADAVQLTSGERRPNFSELDGAPLIAEVVRRIAGEAAARDIEVRWKAEGETFRADADLVTRALERIVQCALWHAPSGGTVAIALEDHAIEVHAGKSARLSSDSSVRSLAMHFAEAALRAQGGAVWTERDEDGTVVYRMKLP